MSKIDLLEMEENPNYEAEQQEQAKLKAEYEKQEQAEAIWNAIELLTSNGYIVKMKVK